METPPTVTFRGVPRPELLESDIRTRLARLERYYPSIVSARVRVDFSGRHRGGNRYRVLVELGVPGADVIVAHDASIRPGVLARGERRIQKKDESNSDHRNAKVAIRDAFEAARRRLQDYSKRRRPKS
jgi:ribosome-associated translation inhibitor RaiA